MTDKYIVRRDLDTSWMDRGNCLGLSVDLFFSVGKENMPEAKDVCAKCVVRAECLQHAMDAPERFGCWGGTSPHERNELAKEWDGRTFDAKAAIVAIDKARRPRHGDHAGYQRHRRNGEPPCAECAKGDREYRRKQVSEWRRQKRSAS